MAVVDMCEMADTLFLIKSIRKPPDSFNINNHITSILAHQLAKSTQLQNSYGANISRH